MQIFMFIFVALLFYVLTPGVFLSLPPKSSKRVVALTHAVVFAVVWTLIHKTVWNFGTSMGWTAPRQQRPRNNYVENFFEGFKEGKRGGKGGKKGKKDATTTSPPS